MDNIKSKEDIAFDKLTQEMSYYKTTRNGIKISYITVERITQALVNVFVDFDIISGCELTDINDCGARIINISKVEDKYCILVDLRGDEQ